MSFANRSPAEAVKAVLVTTSERLCVCRYLVEGCAIFNGEVFTSVPFRNDVIPDDAKGE